MSAAAPALRRRARVRGSAGLTLLEVLIATGLLSLVMAAAYTSLIAQLRQHAAQMLTSETMHAGRSAFDVMAADLNNAGFGVPMPSTPAQAPALVIAQPRRLRFWSNTATAHTYLSAAAALDANAVSVLSTTGIRAGGRVYISDLNRWHLGTVKSVGGTTVRLTGKLAYNFPAGTLVTPVELITYRVTRGALTRNGRAIIPNVTNLRFTYDSATLASIRTITAELSVQARASAIPGAARRTITLASRITPVNLAL